VVAEVVGQCINGNISFRAAVASFDPEQRIELPWQDKLEDYRTEIGKFMQVIYLPITVKINEDEPQIIKRLHEERFRNVIRLVTLLPDQLPASDHELSTTKSREYVSAEIDDFLSTPEKEALTMSYPDKNPTISEVRKIMVQFETSKAAMPIKIMMDDPAIQKLVDFCQHQ
jgi:hypothetical protein